MTNGRKAFLDAEVRCDFTVSPERKRLWKCLLDMLEAVTRICDRHGITYYLDGGSLLGAVRHHGIIPWDDDIDINVFRKDYEKLQEILPKELPAYYFMQTSGTDPQYTITHMKIRDSRTSAIALYHVAERRTYNMGLFLDVFPIDGMPSGAKEERRQLRDLRIVKTIHALATTKVGKGLKRRVAMFICRLIYKIVGGRNLYRLRERIVARYSDPMPQRIVSALGESNYKYERDICWYREAVPAQFEYLTCLIPIGCEDCLTKQYGDWRTPVACPTNHGEMVFDLEKDYKMKLIEEYGYTADDFAAHK